MENSFPRSFAARAFVIRREATLLASSYLTPSWLPRSSQGAAKAIQSIGEGRFAIHDTPQFTFQENWENMKLFDPRQQKPERQNSLPWVNRPTPGFKCQHHGRVHVKLKRSRSSLRSSGKGPDPVSGIVVGRHTDFDVTIKQCVWSEFCMRYLPQTQDSLRR